MLKENSDQKPIKLFVTAKSRNLWWDGPDAFLNKNLRLAEENNKNIILVILSMEDFNPNDLELRTYPYPIFILDRVENPKTLPYGLKGEQIGENAYRVESGTLIVNKKRIRLSYNLTNFFIPCYAVLGGEKQNITSPGGPQYYEETKNMKMRALCCYLPGVTDMAIVEMTIKRPKIYHCNKMIYEVDL